MNTRNLIIKIFQIGYLLNALAVLGLIFFGISYPQTLGFLARIGLFYGKLTLPLLTITLVPGLTQRLQILPLTTKLVMPYRRHFGISTYLAGVAHATLTVFLPSFATKSQPVYNLFIIFGILALSTLTPLFLTSNNYSVRLLKRNWTKLHKLVYLAILFIFLHLALQKNSLALIAGTLLIAEITSYMVLWTRSKKAPPNPQDPNQQTC